MPYRYKEKRKKAIKKQAKLFLFIVVVCFLATGGIYLATEIVPDFVDEQLEKAIMAETEKMLSEGSDVAGVDKPGKLGAGNLSPATIGKLKQALKGGMGGPRVVDRLMNKGFGDRRMDPRTIGRSRRARKGRKGEPGKDGGLDSATIEKLKQAYRGGKIDQAAVERARQAYSKGKIDSSMIEKAKKAYRRGELDPELIKKAKKALAGSK